MPPILRALRPLSPFFIFTERPRDRPRPDSSPLSFSSAEFRPLSRESRPEAADDRVLRRVGYAFTDGDTETHAEMSSG